MIIAYHGTSFVNAESIKIEGFKPGTYFAFAKKHAYHFGGPVIFIVEFSDDPQYWHGEPDGWQFWIRERVSIDNIKAVEIWNKQDALLRL